MAQTPVHTIPPHVTTWSVKLPHADQPLTYGDVHQIMYRDIAMGNDYRKERIKHLATIATGVFALTAAFHKDLLGDSTEKPALLLLLFGLVLLVLSLLAGIQHFREWEDFYLSHRDPQRALWAYHVGDDAGKDAAAAQWRDGVQKIQEHQKGYRRWNGLQTGFLVAGMFFIIFSIAASLLL